MSVKRRQALVVSVALAMVTLCADAQAQTSGTPAVEPLPPGAMGRLGTMRLRHGSRILCLAYSPNNRIIAGGGGDDPVRLWDADTGLQLRTCNDTWVNALVFSPRGSVLVTAGAFKTIRLWEVATGKLYNQLKGHEAPVKALALSPDGSMLASADQDGLIILWELGFAKEITRFKGHVGEVNALAFSPDNNTLASGGGDRTVRLWDAENNKHKLTLDGRCAVYSLVFVDNKTVASGGDDRQVRIWDAATGKMMKDLAGHEDTVSGLQISRDGKTLLSGGRDKAIRLWDVKTGKQVLRIGRNAGDCDALAISRDGKHIVAAGFNNIIRRWDFAGKEIELATGQHGPVTALAVSPNGKLLVTGSVLGLMRVWDLGTGKQVRQWARPTGGDLILAFSPDGSTIASASGTDAIRIFDVADGAEKGSIMGGAEVLSLVFAPDGKTLAAGYRRQGVRIWEVMQPRVVQQMNYPGPVSALAYGRGGRILAAAGSGAAVLYDAATGQEIRRVGPTDASAAVASLAFSPDGQTFATGCLDGIIRLWNAQTGDRLRDLEGHSAVIYALAFSGDSRNLASSSFDRTVRLWEVFSGHGISTWKGHNGPALAVGMTASGRTVVSGSTDTTLLLWDVTGHMKDGKLTGANLSADDLKKSWKELASEDAPRANRALWDLIAAGKQGVPFLGEQVFLVDPAKIKQLLEDLNNNKYVVRAKASGELARYGRWMEGVFKDALKAPKSEEVRRRLTELLEALQKPGSLSLLQERLRLERILLAMEQDGGPEARKILQNIVRDAPEEAFRQAAQATLDRLGSRRRVGTAAQSD